MTDKEMIAANLIPEAEPMWTLEEAILLVQHLQPHVNEIGYSLNLGGGVLLNGFSANDLNLACLPLPEYIGARPPINILEVLQRHGKTQDANYAFAFEKTTVAGGTIMYSFWDFHTEKRLEIRFQVTF